MVDGKPLKEYKESADTSAGNEEFHYVQSITGQTFSIQCRIQVGTKIKGDALTFDVYADGALIDRPFVQSTYFAYSDAIRPIEGHIVQGGKVQRLRFSNLRKVEDDQQLSLGQDRIESVGTIYVKVGYCKVLEKRGQVLGTDKDITMLSKVPEKALKGQAISHSISAWVTEAIDPGNPVAAVFKFYYRSIKDLKDMMIIPRTPAELRMAYARQCKFEKGTGIERERVEECSRPRKVQRQSRGENVEVKHERVEDILSPQGAEYQGSGGRAIMKREQTGDDVGLPEDGDQSSGEKVVIKREPIDDSTLGIGI
ncbi:hypothetical protein HII31_02710 [Pseudocercospora fuligena]|uniref:DUF7918 domain-containing protein n=1 Tax=Pseudocercospora fuligena TaxID=685502 RepID=A0A8H6RRD4_9PEZI|nr:hypothetical protein HII31_02710 [Pseudocercospora fuligena]